MKMARKFSPTKIPGSISRHRREWKGGTLLFRRPPTGAIPGEVFADEKTLAVNGATIALKYYGPSHTDGDISAYFPEADVLHCGDTWWNGHYPFIDYSTGGNIKGMIRAAESNLAKVTDKTIVIPGHGKIAGKAERTEYRGMLGTTYERIGALQEVRKAVGGI